MSQFFSRSTASSPLRAAPPTHPSEPPLPPPKSHVIRLPENSTPPTNVAIPTVWFQSLKGLHGITCDISGQHPDTRMPPTRPPFTTPPQKSHAIRLLKHSTKPRNAAIPTIRFQYLKGLHGNCMRHFSATTPNNARTRPHTPTHANTTTRQRANAAPHHRTPGCPPPRPGLVTRARHRAPASSRASTHTPAQ